MTAISYFLPSFFHIQGFKEKAKHFDWTSILEIHLWVFGSIGKNRNEFFPISFHFITNIFWMEQSLKSLRDDG